MSFLFVGFPYGDTQCPSVISYILVTCPVHVYFRLLACSIMTGTFVFSLTKMFVFLSRYVMFNIILLSIFVCASLFLAWMVIAHFSAAYVIAGSTHELHLSLQSCSNVTLEDVAVLDECCPSGRDFSLNFLVLVYIWCCISVSGRRM